jgi:protein-L-isoaspartate(D-aspartate) O-methyltransferase
MPNFSADRDIPLDSAAPLDLMGTAPETRVSFLLALRARGVRHTGLLRAMENIPRRLFAPPRCGDLANADMSLPLPCGQTMLAPVSVALLIEALAPQEGQRVLEIGTGSGYSAALLGRLAGRVTSVERYRTLAMAAVERLAGVGCANVEVRHADGFVAAGALGPFDRILFTGSVLAMPPALVEALAAGGRIAGVVGTGAQARLMSVVRDADGAQRVETGPFLRVPPLVPGLARAL